MKTYRIQINDINSSHVNYKLKHVLGEIPTACITAHDNITVRIDDKTCCVLELSYEGPFDYFTTELIFVNGNPCL